MSLCCSDRDVVSLHSFPTRRSSDLGRITEDDVRNARGGATSAPAGEGRREPLRGVRRAIAEHLTRARSSDRKSTRLNSSHRCISYAVFCLKKKKRTLAHSIYDSGRT